MEVSHHQSPLCLGVRTRAKTLALQRLGKSTAAAPSTVASAGSYLQLRSRRLEKPTILIESKRQKQISVRPDSSSRANSRLRVGSVNSGSNRLKVEDGGQLEREKAAGVDKEDDEIQERNQNENPDVGIEASFGENVLEFEGRERGKRETTPCSLIRDPDTIRTPSSTTRPTNLTDATAQNSMRRHIPTTHEMDEFFSGAEDQQQKQFIDKYNFDPMNDKPLPGRYEWVKVDP